VNVNHNALETFCEYRNPADWASNHLKDNGMKKLLSLAALFLACIPGAYAQNNGAGLAGHPDARNDRQMESVHRPTLRGQKHGGVKQMQHKRHFRIAKNHHLHRAA
jgi:hypothetical protein